MLIEHPRLFERHPQIFPSARMLVEAPYVILYETRPDTDESDIHTIEIVRVVDGLRDIFALFQRSFKRALRPARNAIALNRHITPKFDFDFRRYAPALPIDLASCRKSS